MQHEVRSIPPAPRRVRLRALLAHRWPLLAIGGAMTVIGSLIAWLMFLQSGGKFSLGPRLDLGPTRLVEATVRAVLDPVDFDGRTWQDVRYTFEHGSGSRLSGGSFVPAGTCSVGQQVQVEYLEADPNVSRVLGGVLHIDRKWLRGRFWVVIMTVPGALILLAWLAGVFQLRQVLVHGDVSVGRVLAVEPVRFVLPEMLRVAYEFRDHRAATRKNQHWVRAHGVLGLRLSQQGSRRRYEPIPVLHDRRLPQWNRLLLPQDFLRSTTPDATIHELT